jgi:hypothetical protein
MRAARPSFLRLLSGQAIDALVVPKKKRKMKEKKKNVSEALLSVMAQLLHVVSYLLRSRADVDARGCDLLALLMSKASSR